MNPAWRKAIAGFEVLGGVVGAVGVVASLGPHSAPAALVLGVALVVAYLVAALAGVLLWRGARAGRILSAAVFLVQLPRVWSVPVTCGVWFGPDISPTVIARPDGFRGVVFDLRLFPFAVVATGSPGAPTGLGVSAVSCVALWHLLGRGRRPVAASHGPAGDEPAGDEPAAGISDAVAAFREARRAIQRAKGPPEPAAAPDRDP
ncbi:hypothetical protein R5W24_003518 [Gemmata sp. JC717]|uniref:hypothetical protein n=1 Tax=Gemmata algarum TaxID=2975278 RepID=UPI0021BAA6C9|nr:hypothetical protein [Gemmata algarum]MDY3554396.1 hypothetical protein [Gemmata algarum]